MNELQRRTILLRLALASALMLGSMACEATMDKPARPVDSSEADLAIGATKVFFAHQSVGGNIVDGIADLQRDGKLPSLKIVGMSAAASTEGGFIAHALLGTNGNPRGKTDAFVAALEDGLGRQVDVAFQKYCFVDIDASTDVDQLFNYYRQAMIRVHSEFPDLTLVHVTAPIVRVQAGPRAVIKKLLGRTPEFYDDNAARERFNARMRSEYAQREPVFDLAALEASRPGEAPEAVQFDGRTFYQLRPEYTTDGAHLNEAARRRVADELLRFLHGLASTRVARHSTGPR